ncbi:uncharacterized protein LOC127104653 [Lathyrus oleraceus]|uniref:Uncharacterized protein n=1 Tax=Pisum sativum TaxID=3888 RepID=A0A9D4VYU6_PEA|nr:uncharacterized protein LOC127104653 [Pisum sativum]KAI5391429.1 hypothetical protein KIW84_076294 [Pisum sativum]
MVSSLIPLCPKELEDKSVLSNSLTHCQPEQENNNLEDAKGATNFDVKNKLSSSVLITKNGRKIPIIKKYKIPTKKRSPVDYVRLTHTRLTPMEKFQKQLLDEWNEQVKLSESSSEEDILLFDNKNNFIADNEIGLGCILLKPDCGSM